VQTRIDDAAQAAAAVRRTTRRLARRIGIGVALARRVGGSVLAHAC
jgi:hypothetical protein